MSANILKTIVNQIATDMANIAVASGFNNTLLASNVLKKFVPVDSAGSRPLVCVASARSDPSTQTDQVTYDVPVLIEVFGYVQDIEDPLLAALDLGSDMEKAIYDDETLGGNIHDMSCTFNAASVDDLGVVLMSLKATANYFV